MRIFKFALAALFFFAGSVASAQSDYSAAGNASALLPRQWNMVYFQYSPTVEHAEYRFTDNTLKSNLNLNGLAFGYAHAFGIARSLPLYVLAGGELKYSFRKKKEKEDVFFSLKVPVNVTYNFQITDRIGILPFMGLYARYNISGTTKDGNGDKINLFDSNENVMGDAAYDRLQFGGQFGCNVLFSRQFMAGVSYSHDFSKLLDKQDQQISTRAINISVGYIF